MGFQIESGSGNGRLAEVNDGKQLVVYAEIIEQFAYESREGLAYYFPSDFIALTTTASYSGIVYIKNTASMDFKIHTVRFSNSQPTYWKLLKQPTAGTLITSGAAGTPLNANYASGNTFTGTFTIGSNGLTVTDGALMAQVYNNTGATVTEYVGGLILTQNTTLAIICKPSAACDIGCTIWGFYDKD